MAPLTTGPGTLVANRFELESIAGSGGMGVVFRARDRETGGPVAVKLLAPGRSTTATNEQDMERLLREARILAELRHPAIVAYVGHGRTMQGEVFLAMEWLEGETLQERLRRKSLSLTECLTLIRRVAEVLALVHERGIIHRDIKPSNLFLRQGVVERVSLLDFGIARGLGSLSVTRTGEVVGTLQYLAPEQARGARQLDPSADIYALGCVLYQCLTGAPPFDEDNAAVLLARILCEEVTPIGRRRPGLPAALEELVGRMLDKQPSRRLQNGTGLLAALEGLELPSPAEQDRRAKRSASISGPLPPLTRNELRLVSIILATPEPGRPETAGKGLLLGELATLLRPYNAEVAQLLEGTLMVILSSGDTATDLAVRAARSAWIVRRHLPRAHLALAMGRGLMSEALPVGEAIERAGRLLLACAEAAGDAGGPGEGQVWTDALTAGLLQGRFRQREVAAGTFVLEGERWLLDDTRRLLGRTTSCVGREQELQMLETLLADCIEEGRAHLMLVVSPAGMGKSRLRQEFLRRVEAREEAVEVIIGHGDPLHKGSSHAVLLQALLRLCGLIEYGDEVPPAVRRERFLGRMGRHFGAAERRGVEEFLCELCGIPWLGDESAAFKAARQDPRIMNEQLTRALLAFLRAECSVHPVLLVLEDLHWCDAATVRLVDSVLRELAEKPLFVLALGRPEVKDSFPRLWQERSFQEMRLRGLSRRASGQLVQEALGQDAAPETVERLVVRAEGNALFLEELIRAEAEGAGTELPGTLLAMMQARFLRLAPGARQILRAASVFGETFWRGGLVTLLGAEQAADEEVDRWLTVLMEQETVVHQAECRFAGETQYAFRHAFMRDAAYSLLTEEDRRIGHRAVGRYLERMGEKDAGAIAEHYRLGEARDRAALFYARAAGQALDVSDIQSALALAEKGIECQAQGEVLGLLRSVAAQANVWQGNAEAGCQAGSVALELLPPGTAPWYRTGTIILGVLGVMGQREPLLGELRRFEAVEPLPGAESAFIECQAVGGIFSCSLTGLREGAAACLGHLEKVARGLGPSDARALGLAHLGVSCFQLFVEGDPWPAWVAGRAAMAALERAEDHRFAGSTTGHVAFIEAMMGDEAQARTAFLRSIEMLRSLQEYMLMISLQAYGAVAIADGGSLEDLGLARTWAESVVSLLPIPTFWSGMARSALAGILAEQGALDEAEAQARQALAGFAPSAGRVLAFGQLCRILREQGRMAEARAMAEEGVTLLDALGGRSWFDGKFRLHAAQALHAAGDLEGARRVLATACSEIRRRALRIEDPARRASFLGRTKDNVRVQALARDWGLTLPIPEGI